MTRPHDELDPPHLLVLVQIVRSQIVPGIAVVPMFGRTCRYAVVGLHETAAEPPPNPVSVGLFGFSLSGAARQLDPAPGARNRTPEIAAWFRQVCQDLNQRNLCAVSSYRNMLRVINHLVLAGRTRSQSQVAFN